MAQPISIQEPTPIRLEQVKTNPKVVKLIDGANEVMRSMGYTEHGHRHVGVVSDRTGEILTSLEVAPREIELGQIAAYLHDIGNVINRINHPLHGRLCRTASSMRWGWMPLKSLLFWVR